VKKRLNCVIEVPPGDRTDSTAGLKEPQSSMGPQVPSLAGTDTRVGMSSAPFPRRTRPVLTSRRHRHTTRRGQYTAQQRLPSARGDECIHSFNGAAYCAEVYNGHVLLARLLLLCWALILRYIYRPRFDLLWICCRYFNLSYDKSKQWNVSIRPIPSAEKPNPLFVR